MTEITTVYMGSGNHIENIQGDCVMGNKIVTNTTQQIHNGIGDNVVQTTNQYNQSGNFGIGHMSGGKLKNNAQVSGQQILTNVTAQNISLGDLTQINTVQQTHNGVGDNIASLKTQQNFNGTVLVATANIEGDQNVSYNHSNCKPGIGDEIPNGSYNEECFQIITEMIYGFRDCISSKTTSIEYNQMVATILKAIEDSPKLAPYYSKFKTFLAPGLKRELPKKFEKIVYLLEMYFLM